jgi:hypothetical protein
VKGKRVVIVVAAVAAVLVGLGAWVALDLAANARIVKIPDLPEKPIEGGADALLAKLERGGAFDPAIDGPAGCLPLRAGTVRLLRLPAAIHAEDPAPPRGQAGRGNA